MPGTTIELTAADGHRLSAYRADPAGPSKGGVVVIQEVFGVNHHIRSVADLLASHGYSAVAPAIFDRYERGVELGYDETDFNRAIGMMGKVDIAKALADVQAAVAALAGTGKIGVTGFCFGGLLTWLASAGVTGIAAAVGYYGGNIPNNLAIVPKVPVMLHFGDRDPYIPMPEVEKTRAAHPEVEIHVYAADHGFNCDERGSYDKPSAELARSRTLAFFDKHLG